MKAKTSSSRRATGMATVVALLTLVLGAVTPAAAAPASGGSLTVLESGGIGAWPAGLDPGTNTQYGANVTESDAIFGELFELGPGGKTIGDLASGHQLSSDAKTLTIDIRHGVTFSDGSPFNAAAVAFNLNRDLKSTTGGAPNWALASIATPNDYTVVIHLKAADGAMVNQFQGASINSIMSPTALTKMGEKQFSLTPVGAGPFTVVSDTLSSKLVLARNPTYWQKGHPYLDSLTFETVATDESALEALRSGAGQAYENLSTPGLVSSYRSAGLTVTAEPSTSPSDIELNTATAPFSNITAREAIYYATDPAVIDKSLFNSVDALTESFTSPSGLFYVGQVPGYRTYDLAKAKALVTQLGGLSFNIFANATGESQQFVEALQTMWKAAGMTVTLSVDSLSTFISTYQSKNWQASLGGSGSWDPAAPHGVAFGFAPPSPFTGVNDPHLTNLLDEAQAAAQPATRASLYKQAADYISQQAYAPFLFAPVSWNVAAKGVAGPGLTTSNLPITDNNPAILWEDVTVSHTS
jgi:peptide/nickel transport system substrate-binding protein